MKFKEMEHFFVNQWAPLIIQIHRPGGEIFSTVIADITTGLREITTHQVCVQI